MKKAAAKITIDEKDFGSIMIKLMELFSRGKCVSISEYDGSLNEIFKNQISKAGNYGRTQRSGSVDKETIKSLREQFIVRI